MIRKHFKVFLVFVAIALSLDFIFFFRLKEGQFLFIGDQFFRFSFFETFINSFFIRKLEFFGVHNGWQFMTQFWDVLYYFVVYKLGISLFSAEKILFFIVLLISLWFSFIGFQRIKMFFRIASSEISVLVVTLWYCFNPYTVELWHGGVYNLGSALTYSLFPLVFYYFHASVFSRSNLRTKVTCVILLFFASFTFWLFAPLVFFLIAYSILYLLFNRKVVVIFLKNSFMLLCIYLPLILFELFSILHENYSNAGDNNSVYLPTFGNEAGGIWYQMLLLFSWGIYNVWTPRSMYSFHAYYFAPHYIVATATIYFIIFFGVLKFYAFTQEPPDLLNKLEDVHPRAVLVNSRQARWRLMKEKFFENIKIFATPIFKKTVFSPKSKEITILFILLGISLFFAKAAQAPLGHIFLFFYEHVPFFRVFRTADIRFGFLVVFVITLLLLYVSIRYKKYFFCFVIIVILLFQSKFLFNGIAIIGENVDKLFYDRILSVPKDYQEVIDFLNKDDGSSGYILPIPSMEYGRYILEGTNDEGEYHVGQDVLSKFIKRPFVYLSQSGGMYTKTYTALDSSIKSRIYNELRAFPIKYILVRRDIPCDACVKPTDKEVGEIFARVFTNKTFSVFAVDNYKPVVSSNNSVFKALNPVKYSIQFNNVKKAQTLNFMLSFNKHWKLYINKIKNRFNCSDGREYRYSTTKECVANYRYFEGEELSYLWKKPLFENTHSEINAYANSWNIDPEFIRNNFDKRFYSINKDGSINFELVIYYQPQSWFYITFIVSALSLLMACLYLFVPKLKKHSH